MWVVFIAALSSGCAGPEGVVHEASSAAAQGDREGYLACFTARSRSMLRAIWQTADPINPAPFALGASSSPIRILETHRLPADRDGNARALVVITENKAVLPLILHHVGTQWRIDLLDSERMTSGGSDGLSGGLKF